MRRSKYLGKTFGNWICTHVGIARVQPKQKMNSKGKAKRAGHQSYYYIMERRTSDNKADKMIRLDNREAAQVYRGLITVEEILEAREAIRENRFTKEVSYHFD